MCERLQRSELNINIKKGFAFFIYKSNIQVMIKRIVRNQIANLAPNH
jgi:hypothetical protein